MSQAKGVLPTRGEDREVLYRNPQTCGYFVAARLDLGLDRERLGQWLSSVSALVDALVARGPAEPGKEKGPKLAAVAVGLAQTFFALPNVAPQLEPPASFSADVALPNTAPPLSSVPVVEGDVMFYVASVRESRVNAFAAALSALPGTTAVRIDRGYQREDDTEQFGYRDGVRNSLPKGDRPAVVFVHRDGPEADEPDWADGGTYLAYMKLRQHPAVFTALSDEKARDEVMGRNKDGQRLDLVGTGTRVADEPEEFGAAVPAASHVRKTGPRGKHDAVQIFRRGLPYMETTPAGELAVGLHFCSFQAALEQFDVVHNDWAVNRRFPHVPGAPDPGPDALLDPARRLVTTERVGFFFVPPHHPQGLAAAVLPEQERARGKRTGRIVVRKRIIDPADPAARFERSGFRFVVLDDQSNQVPGAEFETDLTGRGVCPVDLEVGRTYIVRETASPLPGIQPAADTTVAMDRPHKTVPVVNTATSASPYAVG